MILPAILDPFAERGAPALMTRLVLDGIVEEDAINRLFDEIAEGQYTRELTLAHLVQAMLDVASGHRPSPRAAFLAHQLDRLATVQAFYGKLKRMRPDITASVVRQVAPRARPAGPPAAREICPPGWGPPGPSRSRALPPASSTAPS